MKDCEQKFPVTTSGHDKGHPLLQNVHIGAGPQLAPNSVCTGVLSWGKAAQGVTLLTSDATVMYEWSCTSAPLIRLRSLDRDVNIPPQIALKKHWRCIGVCVWLLI